MAKRRVRFLSPTMYGGVSYAQNQVVELQDEDANALGNTVEAADDVEVESEAQRLANEAPDPDTRAEAAMIKSEPGDAQDVPDALRDEQANADGRKVKALGNAPVNKQVEKPAKNK